MNILERSRLVTVKNVSNILFLILIENIENNPIFIDSSNIFNPYKVSKLGKLFGIKNILSKIHIVRAFTDYQLESLVEDLNISIKEKNASIVIMSDISSLFEENNIYKLDNIIDDIKSLAIEFGIIVVIETSKMSEQIIKSKADNELDIDQYIKNMENIMGRTVPSFRSHLEETISELSVFRRALRGEDKIAFDNLIEKSRKHASSCSIVPTLDPMCCILLSILIEQQKEIDSLINRLNENYNENHNENYESSFKDKD